MKHPLVSSSTSYFTINLNIVIYWRHSSLTSTFSKCRGPGTVHSHNDLWYLEYILMQYWLSVLGPFFRQVKTSFHKSSTKSILSAWGKFWGHYSTGLMIWWLVLRTKSLLLSSATDHSQNWLGWIGMSKITGSKMSKTHTLLARTTLTIWKTSLL